MPNPSNDWHSIDTIPVEKPSEVLTVTGMVCVARPRPFRDATRHISEAGRYGPRCVACVRADDRYGSNVMVLGWKPIPPKIVFTKDELDASLYREIGGILECRIDGRHVFLRRVEGNYDYDKDRSTCPTCGKLGIPWKGLFSCGETDRHVAVVQTGQCFMVYRRRPATGTSGEDSG